MIRRIEIFGYTLLVLGIVGFLSGPLLSLLNNPGKVSSFELPLGLLEGVAVDSVGNVYCGSQYYGRVQKYDPDGRFLFAIEICNNDSLRIRVNRNDELEVATAKRDELFRFSPEGKLLQLHRGMTNIYAEFGSRHQCECIGPNGSTYRLGFLSSVFPAVAKYTIDGEYRTIVSVPFYLWIVMGPLPAWLIALIGALVSLWMSYAEKEEARIAMGKTELRQEVSSPE